jgi:beta-ribofuranosylaminobenzene 5'-phosphate synthase
VKVSVVAYPRLHFGLTDLAGATGRSYGGIGAHFRGPEVHIEGRADSSFVLDLGASHGDEETKVGDAALRARESGLPLSGSVTVLKRPPSHAGLGSTTATTLAVMKALAVLNRWPIDSRELIRLSGRGRTSAVGCNGFFLGGLIVDAGQPGGSRTTSYLPSIAPEGRSPSLFLGRWEMPTDWNVSLAFVNDPPTVHPGSERGFFEKNTPTTGTDTLEQIADVFHGMIPALLEHDLDQFGQSLRRFQVKGFKAREIAAQPQAVRVAIEHLWEAGIPAGLSSLGPTVFAVHEAGSFGRITEVLRGIDLSGPYDFQNAGHELEIYNGPA